MGGFRQLWEASLESLDQDRVYKHLESGFKIGGFEAPDLLLSLGAGAFSNLIFGQSSIGGLLTILVPSVSLLTLYFIKRGKPKGYLFHLIRYLSLPEVFEARKQSPNAFYEGLMYEQ